MRSRRSSSCNDPRDLCIIGLMKILPDEGEIAGEDSWRDQTFSDTMSDGQVISWKVGDIFDYVDGRGYPVQIPVELLEEDNLQASPEDVTDEVVGSPGFIVRASQSDLSYPIIVVRYQPSWRDPDGALYIADGVHRLWKAIDDGYEFIDSYLLEEDDLWDIDHTVSLPDF